MNKRSDSEKIIQLSAGYDAEYYNKLLSKNIQFIEKQIRIALKLIDENASFRASLQMEDEALELFNNLIDKLKYDDFRILRQFRGRSKFTTYLSSIISREVVNMIRKKKGRKREKDRARALGEIGERIYKLVFFEKYTINDAITIIIEDTKTVITVKEAERIVDKIKGDKKVSYTLEDQNVVKEGQVDYEKDELIAINGSNNPEENIIQKNGKSKTFKVLNTILSKLNREDKLLLRMRFPADETEEPLDIDTIAKIIKTNKKTVYTRISRLLKKCKARFDEQGITVDDYFK